MHRRILSSLSVLASLCFTLSFAHEARAQGPEWFDPEPVKPAPAEGKPAAAEGKPAPADGQAEAPKAKPGARKGEATPKAEAQAAPPVCPPPVHVAKPKAAEPARVEWYGWQTIATDLSAVALMTAGASSEGGGLALAGLGAYLLGGPIVHAANGQWGKGMGSLGLRLGAPVVGALGGLLVGGPACHTESRSRDGYEELGSGLCQAAYGGLGLVLGAITAAGVDAALLAKKEVRPRPTFSLAPSVVPTRQGTTFGLAGTF